MLNDHSPVFQLSPCANKIAKQSVFFRESYAHEAREPHTPVGLALCFQPRSRPICLTARAYLNTQKYGLFCSLCTNTSSSTFFAWNLMFALNC